MDKSRAAMYSISFWKKGEKLTTDELRNLLEYAMAIDNFETKTSLMSFIRVAHTKKGHCYLKEDDPWKTVWWDFIKKWYVEVKNLGKEDEVKDIIN